ncbi:Coiled-coil domain-containing protein 40 [Schistosoma haematobium]|uniref:Coiled-coil domain-containing protein 40 n=1 Tax=Schistosoma haematobium TaxID=6185 RepID=A0A922LPU4_SCHHA|nr:Coiled-coil domain-containing protein 40 [Schistosoma haematobium]KAH9591151.1 Coiled-coil domain-containing protein 40 [Schistosoma haematobium]CAH8666452.1 unnamed protein product [Schistosoma haematobium]
MSFSENPNSQSEQNHEEFKTLPDETLGTVEQHGILNDNSRRNEVDVETEQNDLIVLDPDHPLMRRFQESLRSMLTKHIDNTEIHLREKDEEMKREKTAHIEVGCVLYNLQQELAKFQLNLDNKHNEYAEYHGKYENAQNKLTTLREKYQTSVKTMLQETKKMHSMRDEVDALCLRLYYLNKAKQDVSGDLLVLQRAVEKVHTDLSKFEDEKLRQDLSVDRMQTKVDQLKDDITLYEAQIVAQEIEMNTSQNLLYEAEAQIVAINVDKAHLLTQWKTSLLGLQRRNEAYADLLAAYNKLKEELLVLENEQNAYKLSINKEQETHERLTGLQNKNESDLNTLCKQLLHSETKLEADKQAYTTYSRILLETERNLFNAKTENNTAQANVNNIRKQLEKKVLEKQDLEKKISEELRDRLTAQKAANYANKININVQDQSRELLTQIVQMENQIAKDELGVAHKKARNKQQQEKVSELEREIDNTNLLITKLEGEIHHANISVERKQGNIDILNKKLERLIRDCGGQEIGPLDAQVNNLNKAIGLKQDEIGELEQQWLREQNELVVNINERDKLAESVTRINKQLSILTQKKLRIDNEIAIQGREKNDLKKELKHLQNDITRINTMIAKEKTTEECLDNENKLTEIDFIRSLKEKETEAANLQEKVDKALKDKEDLLSGLVEVERTIMLWEKKIQLCEETKKSVDCDIGQGEMNVMRHEIHRMEIRKSSLLQQQERLIQALERSVSKRDTIVNQSDVLQSRKDKSQIRITAQRHIDELKRKLKAIKQNSASCIQELEEFEEKTNMLENELRIKKSDAEAEQKKADELMKKLQSLSDQKQINLFELQMRQHATVYWEQIRQDKYRRLCPSATSAENERTRHVNRSRSLMAIIDQLVTEFPQIQQDLEPVRYLLENKLRSENNRLEMDVTTVEPTESLLS